MPPSSDQLREIQPAIRPRAPIEEPASFIGRDLEMARVREGLLEPGLQVVVYGEPGSKET